MARTTYSSTAQTPAPAERRATVPVFDAAWMPFWTLRNDVDDLFDDYLHTTRGGWFAPRHRAGAYPPRPPVQVPTLDVIDKKSEVKLVADLPGMTETDIDVEVNDSTLTISGEKQEEVEDDDEGERYLSERRFGSFTRRIPLPDGIDLDNIEATFRNGVLTVRLPKRPDAQNPARKSEVRAGV